MYALFKKLVEKKKKEKQAEMWTTRASWVDRKQKNKRQGDTGKMAKRLRQQDYVRNQKYKKEKERMETEASSERRQGKEYGKKASLGARGSLIGLW